MSDDLVAKATADLVLKNRESGWLRYAFHVLQAGPYLRGELIDELLESVKKSLIQELPGYKIYIDPRDEGDWFYLNINRNAWGELWVVLCNWKTDASQVTTSVYYEGKRPLSNDAKEQIKVCLKDKGNPFHKPAHISYVWNIWPVHWNWSDLSFLMRVAESRDVVVEEIVKDMVESVELLNKVLTRVAKLERDS